MQTFLVVIGILFACGVITIALIAAWVKKVAAAGALFVLRAGLEALNEKAKADSAAPVRARLEALNTRLNALPKTVSIWNAGTVLGSVKSIGTEMAEIAQELDRLQADDERAKAAAITVDSTVVTPGEQLALPAPSDATNGKSHDEILAEFRTEWVEPGNRGIVDAWLTGSGADTFIQYQLALSVADTAAETGKLPEVPNLYQGLCTLITWFPREN
jgi:hypothetical protein